MPTDAAKPYGWDSAAPTHTHNYLLAPILRQLHAAGAKRVLDLGCGNGALAGALLQAGFQVVGCDADAPGIEIARKAVPGASFHAVGVYDDPASMNEAAFDAVVATEVVEHLFAPRALPRFAHRVLKPGGRLILSTPYHGYLKNVLLAVAGKWDFHHSALWDGGHVKFWSRRTLGQLLSDEGFRVVGFEGAGRLPYLWKSMIMVAEPM